MGAQPMGIAVRSHIIPAQPLSIDKGGLFEAFLTHPTLTAGIASLGL